MSKKILLVPVLAILFCLGCESTENDDPTVEVDTTKPILSVTQLEATIEKATTINVSITDDSAVTTTLTINGDEVFSSAENQFTFEFDPFEYPNGESSVTITATDQENNTTELSFQFELKKLLYRQNFGFSSDSVDSYVAINLAESGELIAFRKISTLEDSSFYADDDFIKQDLIITRFSMSRNVGFYLARSYSGVAPGTSRLSHFEVKAALGLEQKSAIKNNQLNLTIEETPFFNRFSSLGYNFSFGGSSNPTLVLDYDSSFTTDIFISYDTNDNLNLLEDYRYLFLEDFTDTTINFNELSSLSAENVATITLPETVKEYGLSLLGYANEMDYKNNYFRILFGHISETANTGFTLNYPVIDEYEIVKKSLNLDLMDGRKVRLERNDISNIQIPDLSIQQMGNSVNIDGVYDIASIRLTLKNTSNNSSFSRIHQSTFSDAINIPYENLELPTEIVDFLTEKGFTISTKDTSGDMSLSLSQYENQIDFPDGVFYYVIGNETGDVTEVTFPLAN